MATTTYTSLLCVRSAHPLMDAPIRAWDADHISHIGIRIGDHVVDATLRHGVQEWRHEDWIADRVLVDDVPVYPTSSRDEQLAIEELRSRIGQRYDLLEIVGFLLLRDLGDPTRPICSRLAYDYARRCCGLIIVGKQGRLGPRLTRSNLNSYNQGLFASARTAAEQPSTSVHTWA